jgi:hypothetical protein
MVKDEDFKGILEGINEAAEGARKKSMDDLVEVTQADREAAALIEASAFALAGEQGVEAIQRLTREGGRDDGIYVQTLARHRITETERLRDAATTMADVVELQEQIARCAKAFNGQAAQIAELMERRDTDADTIEAQAAEIARLREDKARLDWLVKENCDVRWGSDGGDEVIVQIISHHMAPPKERIEGLNEAEDLRAAIDMARTQALKDTKEQGR